MLITCTKRLSGVNIHPTQKGQPVHKHVPNKASTLKPVQYLKPSSLHNGTF